MTQEEQLKAFEQALEEAWKQYGESGAATVDALEENTQELAFAKGFNAGYKQAIGHPTGGELLHVLNRGCKIGYMDAVAKTEEFLRYYMGKKFNYLTEEDIDAYRKAMTEEHSAEPTGECLI